MRLRLKLGLTLVASIVPFAIALAWFQASSQESAFLEATAEQVIARMDAEGRAQCEDNPQAWPRRRGRRFRRMSSSPRT